MRQAKQHKIWLNSRTAAKQTVWWYHFRMFLCVRVCVCICGSGWHPFARFLLICLSAPFLSFSKTLCVCRFLSFTIEFPLIQHNKCTAMVYEQAHFRSNETTRLKLWPHGSHTSKTHAHWALRQKVESARWKDTIICVLSVGGVQEMNDSKTRKCQQRANEAWKWKLWL